MPRQRLIIDTDPSDLNYLAYYRYGCTLSLPLARTGQPLGAVNLYSHHLGTFDDDRSSPLG